MKATAIEDIMRLFNQRRITGVGIKHADYIKWYHIPCDTSSIDVMRKVHKLTSGRLMIGMASVTVENEKDAIALKLASI